MASASTGATVIGSVSVFGVKSVPIATATNMSTLKNRMLPPIADHCIWGIHAVAAAEPK